MKKQINDHYDYVLKWFCQSKIKISYTFTNYLKNIKNLKNVYKTKLYYLYLGYEYNTNESEKHMIRY